MTRPALPTGDSASTVGGAVPIPPIYPCPRLVEPRTGILGVIDPVAETTQTALPTQGYELDLAPGGGRLAFADEAGRRHGRATLAQLRRAFPGGVPAQRIRDWPDFPVRGYMLDISRDRVPTRETLEHLVRRMDRLRLNHLQLYTEHTFAYPGHEIVWRDASPLDVDDIIWLDQLCSAHGIELAANQNLFGHMERWLRHEPYRHLAESPAGWQTGFGQRMPASVLRPCKESLALAFDLLDTLLPAFSSRRVNIGCDETFELGRGASRAAVERLGLGRVYLDHLLRLLEGVRERGCEPLFWGDVVRNHPELAPELPRDAVGLAWHYEAPFDPELLPEFLLKAIGEFGITQDSLRCFEPHVRPFVEAERPFWVCPGTSSWNTIVGRLDNALGNLRDAAETGRKHGASGFLITDWGDGGHHQPPSVSLPPLVFGAGLAWCAASNAGLQAQLPDLVDGAGFESAGSGLGGLLAGLGGLHARTGLTRFNGSPIYSALMPGPLVTAWGETDAPKLNGLVAELDEIVAAVERLRLGCGDGESVKAELVAASRLARHGLWRLGRHKGLPMPEDAALARDLAEAAELQRAAWLARSRRGGLADSMARVEHAFSEYAQG